MKGIDTLFLWILFFTSLSVNAQSGEAAMYEKAYHYLNDSILSRDFVSSKQLEKNCSSHVKVIGGKLSFESELQVAHRFIELNSQFPLKDMTEKQYNLSKECALALRIGSEECDMVNHMIDSLNTFWADYETQSEAETSKMVQGLPSKQKDGYQVFFSDIYKNTLAAELKEFCSAYDKNQFWTGSSLSFYFVFDEKGEIKKVYSGRVIHYN